MTPTNSKGFFVKQKFDKIYLSADKVVWNVSYVSALFILVEALIYDHLMMALSGVAINFFALFLVDQLVKQRRFKNSLMGLVMLLWPINMVILSDQLHEIRFVAFAFIVILTLYQDVRPVISIGTLAGIIVMGYSIPVILDLPFKDLALYLIREEDASWEKMVATLLVLLVICFASAWLAQLLRQKSISDAQNEYDNIKRQKIFENNKHFASSIAQGDFSFSQNEDDMEHDELSEALEEMRDNLLAADKKEKQDKFINVGLAEIGEILRKNNETLDGLTNQVLRHLVKYLNANQGALFLLEGEGQEQVLRQYACYAFDKKKFVEKEIAVGQGLLGQLVLEKEKIYMTDVPQDYVNITSGLGKANPSCVLLMPLKINEEVVGAMELASFQPMEDYQITFTEKVAVSIASAVSSARINQRTQYLLQEAQEQSEELKTQEEEMRQNMEELTATQEEIQRKSLEMESRIQAIDASGIASIEYELDATIITANEAFLNLMEYDLEDIVGKKHKIFVSPEMAASAEYAQMWEDLAKGAKIEGELERYTKSGKRVYIKGAYTCLRDLNGRPFRIIKLVTDITENRNLIQEAQEKTRQIEEQEREIRQSLETMKELQKESDKQMQEMQYYLDALNTSMITLELNEEGQILNANDSFVKILGYDAEQLATFRHVDLMHEEDALKPEYQALWEQIREGNNTTTIMRRKTAQGEVRWFQSYYFPKTNEQGQIDRVIELSSDFTKEKIQEEKIMQNEKILHERVKNIEDKAYERIVKLKKEMKQKLAEKDEIIASFENK
jgi:methyl-accepting chemotaxis protein